MTITEALLAITGPWSQVSRSAWPSGAYLSVSNGAIYLNADGARVPWRLWEPTLHDLLQDDWVIIAWPTAYSSSHT